MLSGMKRFYRFDPRSIPLWDVHAWKLRSVTILTYVTLFSLAQEYICEETTNSKLLMKLRKNAIMAELGFYMYGF